ncbi:uncharacterized protein A4U43_C05F400 [Asparagus officinalis]|uniref:DUF7804 domain-containing protein n=1 Tax=Asparagus officinalis TaxID=4686 RepID=A0A5P1ESD0_ASPOF|nr:uncharacterized protein LOC109842750 [Asparagus officinalis]ONK67471.1 uncharacterized protein A4U43_C05F400 [Asparagus officinalis]
MEALSTFLGSSNVITGFNTSALNDHSKTRPCCLMMKMKGMMKMDSSTINGSSSSTSSTCPLNQNQAAAATAAATGVFDYKKKKKKKDSVSAEEMDHWIRDSIGEIVKNIRETPVLVEISSQGPSSIPQLHATEASPENWPLIKNKWNRTDSTPDGLMLIEQLNHSSNDDDDESDIKNQTWGLAVQGRGLGCAPSCYILNTCRVRSSSGFCTYFCLIRAKCSGGSLGRQVDRAWLH